MDFDMVTTILHLKVVGRKSFKANPEKLLIIIVHG